MDSKSLENRPLTQFISRLLTLLFFLPAAGSYRYLPDGITIPYAYDGARNDPVTSANDFPHHVLIVYGSKYCSGSLIYSKIVVTAASCFVKNRGELVKVKIGADTITGTGQIIPVAEYKIHEYFKELSALDNDIALLGLQHDVSFGIAVRKIIFVEPEVAIWHNTPLMMTGWGGTDMPIKYLNLLIKFEAIVLKKSECQQHYGNLITSGNFCVRYTTEQHLSDNGGGAMFDDLLVGILSVAGSNTNKYNTAILTNVSYFHRWITLNSKRLLNKYCIAKKETYTSLTSDET